MNIYTFIFLISYNFQKQQPQGGSSVENRGHFPSNSFYSPRQNWNQQSVCKKTLAIYPRFFGRFDVTKFTLHAWNGAVRRPPPTPSSRLLRTDLRLWKNIWAQFLKVEFMTAYFWYGAGVILTTAAHKSGSVLRFIGERCGGAESLDGVCKR